MISHSILIFLKNPHPRWFISSHAINYYLYVMHTWNCNCSQISLLGRECVYWITFLTSQEPSQSWHNTVNILSTLSKTIYHPSLLYLCLNDTINHLVSQTKIHSIILMYLLIQTSYLIFQPMKFQYPKYISIYFSSLCQHFNLSHYWVLSGLLWEFPESSGFQSCKIIELIYLKPFKILPLPFS